MQKKMKSESSVKLEVKTNKNDIGLNTIEELLS